MAKTTAAKVKEESDPARADERLRLRRELVNERTVALLKSRVRALESELAAAADSAARLRASRFAGIKPLQFKPRRSKRDRIRIAFGDMHGCKMSHPAISALLNDIKSLEPDEIILGGDMTDCGGFLAQHHTMGYVAETEYSWEEDNKAANEFLDALQQAAPRAVIEYLEGNHENRVERWIITETLRHTSDAKYLRRILGPESMLELEKRCIRYYPRHKIIGDCRQPGFLRRGKCFFVHEIASGRHAAATALNKVAANIVFFHTHTSDQVIGFRPGIGNIGAWNPGCLCEPRPMWQHSKPNDWTHGYAVQLVAASENFLHINVPIVDGQSLLIPFTTRK